MSTTAIRAEWYAPGGVLPEVVGTASGPQADFANLAERCAAGSWPSQAEAMRILNAAGRTVSDLIAAMGTPRPRPATAPAPVAAVANGTILAQDHQEVDILAKIDQEYCQNQTLISRMGCDKLQYTESRLRTELSKRGIDPRKIGLSR